MGIPIAIALLGKENIGAVSVMVGIVVPLYNVLAVICLEHYNGRNYNTTVWSQYVLFPQRS
jgi:predicted permease